MPEYDIATRIQNPDSFRTIGSLLNFANQAQQLRMNSLNVQQKQETLPADIARIQAESEVAQQTAQPKITQAQTEAKRSQFALSSEQSAKAMQIAGGYAQDPRIVSNDPNGIIDAATEIRSNLESIGVPKQTAEFWASQVSSRAHQPGAALEFLRNAVRGAAGSVAQAGVVNNPATMIQTPGGALAPVQMQPGAPGGVQPVPISALQPQTAQPGVIPAGIPPAQIQTPTTDVLGQPAIAEKNQQGVISFKAPPGSNYRPVMQFPQGESTQTLPEVQVIRTQANALGQAAPGQHFNNKMILELTPDAFTGTGAGKLANIINSVFSANIAPEKLKDPAVAQSQLKHFISLAIQDNAKAQGANTDAARNIAEQAVLPTDSPEKAIKNITKVNDAYVTGNELYNAGMEAAINNPGNQSGVFAARQFRNAWARSFDPRIMLLENAQKTGDTETIDRILGPKDSARYKSAVRELMPKVLTLQALSKGQM